ncbi:MAG: hypothetical protein WB424_01220, partial [Terracidiphilus sp.]
LQETHPLIAQNAMNGAQLRITQDDFDDRATCPRRKRVFGNGVIPVCVFSFFAQSCLRLKD